MLAQSKFILDYAYTWVSYPSALLGKVGEALSQRLGVLVLRMLF